MTVWFTSDTHFGHRNIIGYTNRPFFSVDQMDEALIRNWNEVVRSTDTVYHLGDFAFTKPREASNIARRLLGHKHLIFGNHDKALREDVDFLSHFESARDYGELSVDGQKIVLCHTAFLVWNGSHRGSWNLHGHSHGSLPVSLPYHPAAVARRLDVGVDVWNFYPVEFEWIRNEVMAKRPGG